MDLVIPKTDLLRLVTRCQGVADKKSAMPALANILLDAAAGKLRVAATDLYLAVSGQADAEVSIAGSVALPAKDLFERVKMMPEGPIQIISNETAQTTLKAVGSARRYTVYGLPGSEFPRLPKPAPDAPVLSLPPALLASCLARTSFAISTDESRPHVNSLCVETAGERVIFAATDGHRLAKTEVKVAERQAARQMLLSLKGVGELRKLVDVALADKAAPAVTMTPSDPNVFFDIGGVSFSVKLIDAQFPPYQQVIPASDTYAARVPKAALEEAARAVALAMDDRKGGVTFTFSSGMLRLSCASVDHGQGFDELAIDYAGPEIAVGLNPKYVTDMLGATDTDEVRLGFAGELDPVVVRPGTESEGQSYVCVIMPVRI